MKKDERIFITAKGYPPLRIKGVRNLIKVCEEFLLTGKVVWSMSHYMGMGTAYRKSGRFSSYMRQLKDNSDVKECVILAELSQQVLDKLQEPHFPLVIESKSLQKLFKPLLKKRELDKKYE